MFMNRNQLEEANDSEPDPRFALLLASIGAEELESLRSLYQAVGLDEALARQAAWADLLSFAGPDVEFTPANEAEPAGCIC